MLKVNHEGNLDADNRIVLKNTDGVSYTIDLSKVINRDTDKKDSDSEMRNEKKDKDIK